MLLVAACLTAAGMRGAISCGHDFDFHIVSWLEVARAWHQGVVFPGWAQSPAWQAGEPRFVFYPPLTWMLGALLGSAFGAGVVGWTVAAWTFVFASLLGTGVATRKLAAEWLPKEAAGLAGVLAMVSPYVLFTAFERSALAELAAGVWVPLVLWQATRRCAQAKGTLRAQVLNGAAAGLGLAIAASWLTNAPAGVMVCYMLAGVSAVTAWTERSWWPILRALVAVAGGLGLAAFYLVPAAWEQQWVSIRAAQEVGLRIEDSWLFARHAGTEMVFHDSVLRDASWVLVVTVLAIVLSVAVIVRTGVLRREDRREWLPLLVLVPAVFAMQFPFSTFVWKMLPKVDFLQFPWRLTMLLTPVLAVFAAMALQRWRGTARAVGIAVWMVAAMLASARVFHQACDNEDTIGGQMEQWHGDGFPATDEYAPLGAENAELAAGLPDACLVGDPHAVFGVDEADGVPRWNRQAAPCLATAQAREWGVEEKTVVIETPRDAYLILRLRRFPAWQATINGRASAAAAQREDGLMVLPVRPGVNRIRLRWKTTREVQIGRWITLLAAVAWLLLWRTAADAGSGERSESGTVPGTDLAKRTMPYTKADVD